MILTEHKDTEICTMYNLQCTILNLQFSIKVTGPLCLCVFVFHYLYPMMCVKASKGLGEAKLKNLKT